MQVFVKKIQILCTSEIISKNINQKSFIFKWSKIYGNPTNVILYKVVVNQEKPYEKKQNKTKTKTNKNKQKQKQKQTNKQTNKQTKNRSYP